MKKLTAILMVFFMMLTGCAAKEETPPESPGDVETPQEEPVETPEEKESDELNPEVLSAFEEELLEADDPLEPRRSLNTIMEEESVKTSDAVLSAYLDYLADFKENGMEPYFDDMQKLQPYFEEGTQNLTEAFITEESLRNFFNRFTEMGYRFIQLEGTVDPVVDYRIIETFSAALSQEMKDYGAFMAQESRQVWAADGEIVIPISELGDRIAQGEAFLSAYPDTEKKVHVKELLGYYLSSFFGGLPSTSVAVEGSYSENFLSAYEAFLAAHPHTKTAEVLQTYYDDLQETDFSAPYTETDPETIQKFRDETSERVELVLSELE